MITGIYKIENKINGHIYIGQAVDIKSRWRIHIYSSFHEKHKDYNDVIHRAIRKYGKENFSFEILEEYSRDMLNNKEQYWIEYYDSYYNGYNASKGGNNYEHNTKPIDLYNLQGEYIETIYGAYNVAIKLGVSRNVVYQVLHHQRKSCGGYQIKYQEDPQKIEKYVSSQGGKIPIVQMDLENNIINTFDSIADACRETGFDPSTISKCCKGKLKTHHGYKWEYLDKTI